MGSTTSLNLLSAKFAVNSDLMGSLSMASILVLDKILKKGSPVPMVEKTETAVLKKETGFDCQMIYHWLVDTW